MRRGLLTILLVFVCAAFVSAQTVRHTQMMPTGKGYAVPTAVDDQGVQTDIVHLGNGIDYHGGPIMPGTPNVYLIWYGNWNGGPKPSDSKATINLIRTFITGISGSGYEMINSTYGDNSNDVTGLVNLAGQVVLPRYPLGKNLSDASIIQIVSKVISSGKLPSDTNGVYFVLTTSDVDETSGFCSFYCGWHDHTTIGGKDIKYSFVGNEDRCPSSCEETTDSPNGNSGADGMANVIAHELEEAISDPDLNAWSRGAENADMCAWMWGDVTGDKDHKGYNETFGGKNWLIQMNWENARGGGCDNFLGGPFHTQ